MISTCFIIMGFNIKTNEDGKEYNLNLSYNQIIKPVLERLNINYIRADEIMMTELIDESMYKLLLCADLVIADITTLNANALYELGVRYALKPYSTIIIGDVNTKIPFDINHIRIFTYKHEGTYITDNESARMQKILSDVITTLSLNDNNMIDSPVYKYIGNLIPPQYNGDKNYFEKTTKRFKSSESLCNLINFAYQKRDCGNFEAAIDLYKKALLISKDDYIVKEIAVCIYQQNTYKSFTNALSFIKEHIDIESTTNPEILKTLGTIYKNMWLSNSIKEYAEKALYYYEKSFILLNTYNSGLNYGLMLLVMSSLCEEQERNTYLLWSKKTYENVSKICHTKYDVDDYWVNASLEECYLVLGNTDEYKRYKNIAKTCLQCNPIENTWKRKKTEKQTNLIKKILRMIQ